ncbi:hypothetical protein FOCG_16084 [Fusarium oxysporum f. sp. radicis-lycopersici 26381]|nr:hypothetical protein FOCG_16084 [Fusarium oxysporum f. sp. radicis-lycopersici 26381]
MHESGQTDDDVLPSPDGGYGWVVVGSCFILNALTWCVTASFGVYLTEYVSFKRFANAKLMEYGLIGGLNFSCAILLTPLATHLAGRYPLEAVILLGCFLQSIGYVTAPFASRAQHLYLTQGALVGSGIGFVIVPSTAVLSQWFSKRRSIANGISSAGSGVRGVAFTWGTAAMIKHQGLDWALCATGIITFTIGPLSAEVAGIRNLQAMLSLAWAATILPTASAEVIALMLQGSPAPRTYIYPQVFAGLSYTYIIASGFLAALWINLRHRDSVSQICRLSGGRVM